MKWIWTNPGGIRLFVLQSHKYNSQTPHSRTGLRSVRSALIVTGIHSRGGEEETCFLPLVFQSQTVCQKISRETWEAGTQTEEIHREWTSAGGTAYGSRTWTQLSESCCQPETSEESHLSGGQTGNQHLRVWRCSEYSPTIVFVHF